jgi:uncharacterized protein
MRFEWDERKRKTNLDKPGLDFIDVEAVFFGPYVMAPSTSDSKEERYLATGLLDGRYVTVVFTFCGEAVRVISFRRARYEERQKHKELHGSGA